eukprot:TRINITY_DN4986_c0_g1_i5.p1 TRINITY_DN4986_c0_g1~~TRINITY_DN4986_c0_g1_i5.p1  ORF type:complete len:194 (+),score=36.38 TRINITY_DN4986_c0_g1_i5:135-716(+)
MSGELDLLEIKSRFKNTPLILALSSVKVNVVFKEVMEVDMATDTMSIMYISESDAMMPIDTSQLSHLKTKSNAAVLFQKSDLSAGALTEVNRLVCFEWGISVVPVTDERSAASLIARMITKNVIKPSPSVPISMDDIIIRHDASSSSFLSLFPSLLAQFGSLKAVGAATVEEIAKVKGVTLKMAEDIYKFFHT